MARQRLKQLAPQPGYWDGDIYICGPTAYEQRRAEEERLREREHKRWKKRQASQLSKREAARDETERIER